MRKTTRTHSAGTIYLFVSADDCLVINKEGFVEGTYKDLIELATAVMGLRDDEENINE